MRKTYLAITGALALAACGGGGQQAANDAAADNMVENAADATNYQAEVIALPPGQQNGVFLRAVRDAGFNCQEVTETERFDPVQGNPAWRVTCDNRTPHLISITRDGTAKIVSRTDAK
ncbi:hypothetical protein [Sphingomonas sp.]|uniref:hypothetical protein n=1 Tax=Sphingomonas sp. TaxID=28214 RepID=UPI0031E2D418